MLKKVVKFAGWILGIVLVLLLVVSVYVRAVSTIRPPSAATSVSIDTVVRQPVPGLFLLGNNWFRKSESGLYELYVEGEPFERGLVIGQLTKDLVRHQEKVFTDQIRQLVPGDFYRTLLKYFVGWFNRDLADNVNEEFQLEIFGVSRSASHEFDYIAEPYQRMLNYHAAHDIGHALQNMSLVGCTSFATWAGKSEDSTLIIGRNFDFYVGDEFARDKIVAFYNPSQGHRFMMVTFGGMTGVLSGMNDQGLTVTINAAKSEIPSASATPVSLVAREILQYASTIKEAYSIAEKRKMFVAESFLIGSAQDKKASIIEKTSEGIGMREPTAEYIVSTNHFLGDPLGSTQLNQEHMKTSASVYRFERVEELLDLQQKNSILKTAAILRNQLGKGNEDIGMGNEKSINQLIAHHSVIFQPERGLAWVSTSPWQLGKYVCYNLNKVFAGKPSSSEEIYESALTISADSFLLTSAYKESVKFNKYRFPFNPRKDLVPDSVVKWNPKSYHAYLLAGEYYAEQKNWEKAAGYFEEGLKKEIATEQEREYMQHTLQRYKEKMK
jgi:hypothetical protein